MLCLRQLPCQVFSGTHYLYSKYDESVDRKEIMSGKGRIGPLILKTAIANSSKGKAASTVLKLP